MIIEKKYRETKVLRRKLKKLKHYTKKTFKTKTQVETEKAFNKWATL